MSFLQKGAKISLIDKSNVRFEGVLYSLDSKHYTIVLCDVRTFGTEDRATSSPVAVQSNVYKFMIFSIMNIMEIQAVPNRQESIANLPTGMRSASPAAILPKPAQIPTPPNGQSLGQEARYVEPYAETLHLSSDDLLMEQLILTNSLESKQQHCIAPNHYARPGCGLKCIEELKRQQQHQSAEQTSSISSTYTDPHMARLRSFVNCTSPSNAPIDFAEDYDFEEANTAFEQLCEQYQSDMGLPYAETIERETKEENDNGADSKIVAKKFYNPTSSFFDNFSTKVTKQYQYKFRDRRALQLNLSTFGDAALNRQIHYKHVAPHVGYERCSHFYNYRNNGNNNNNSSAYTARAANPITARAATAYTARAATAYTARAAHPITARAATAYTARAATAYTARAANPITARAATAYTARDAVAAYTARAANPTTARAATAYTARAAHPITARAATAYTARAAHPITARAATAYTARAAHPITARAATAYTARAAHPITARAATAYTARAATAYTARAANPITARAATAYTARAATAYTARAANPITARAATAYTARAANPITARAATAYTARAAHPITARAATAYTARAATAYTARAANPITARAATAYTARAATAYTARAPNPITARAATAYTARAANPITARAATAYTARAATAYTARAATAYTARAAAAYTARAANSTTERNKIATNVCGFCNSKKNNDDQINRKYDSEQISSCGVLRESCSKNVSNVKQNSNTTYSRGLATISAAMKNVEISQFNSNKARTARVCSGTTTTDNSTAANTAHAAAAAATSHTAAAAATAHTAKADLPSNNCN